LEFQRPRQEHSHLVVSSLKSGEQKATMNTHSGVDGGYSECKYYSEVCLTFLADDISKSDVMGRACEILNPFLDKYKLLNEDWRIARVSVERNIYLATCHTSPLAPEEVGLQPRQLFDALGQKPRTFHHTVGRGASYVLRANIFEFLGPRTPLADSALKVFAQFVQEPYDMPLSYEFVMEALSCLQKQHEYRLAVVHAETAFEVYVADSLVKLMVYSGMALPEASLKLEKDRDYWNIKNKIRRLDDWTRTYSSKNSLGFIAFYRSALYDRWETNLYTKRNDAVHSGATKFSYDEASAAIGVAKECIRFLETRVPSLSDRVQLNASMAGFRQVTCELGF